MGTRRHVRDNSRFQTKWHGHRTNVACDCAITPAVLGTAGEPLDIGRAQHLITPAQRKALVLRDRGCSFPGCHRKPKYCEGHHIQAWYDGGHTDLHNPVLS